jgi:DnaJ family protein C protein 13
MKHGHGSPPLQVTNQWPYDEFISIVPNAKSPGSTEFLINMKKKNGKTDTMKFSSDYRAEILTEALVSQ